MVYREQEIELFCSECDARLGEVGGHGCRRCGKPYCAEHIEGPACEGCRPLEQRDRCATIALAGGGGSALALGGAWLDLLPYPLGSAALLFAAIGGSTAAITYGLFGLSASRRWRAVAGLAACVGALAALVIRLV